jgi:hypothetical protein
MRSTLLAAAALLSAVPTAAAEVAQEPGAIAAAAPPMARQSDHSGDFRSVLELSSKYAWGIDTLDRTILESVFAKDATAHYVIVNDSPIKLDERLSGFEAIYAWLKKNLGHRQGHVGLPWHFVSNQLVTLQGDQADLRFYMHNRSGAAGGVYYMQAVRTAHGWRIKNMRLEEQIWDAGVYQKKGTDQ